MRSIPLIVALFCFAASAHAEDVVIESFDSNGGISFTEVTNATGYRVEWAPGPGGPWSSFSAASSALDSIPATGSGSVTASVPMLYRVRATTEPPPTGPVTFEWLTVGNPGNADDTTGYGGVAYTYRIAAHEVSNAQYTKFLNAVDPAGFNPAELYNNAMGSSVWGGINYNSGAANGFKYSVKTNMGDKPVNYVSFFDAMRFVNWLENGQGNGGTERGVYSIGSGLSEMRATNVGYFLPSESEWYKAAYYDPVNSGADGNGTTNYWLYPTQSDAVPTIATAGANGDVSNPGTNVVNYSYAADWNGQSGNVTTVGSAGATSFYGVFDLGGNVYEWNEAAISGSHRGLRGGSWDFVAVALQSSWRISANPATEQNNHGFRVARPQ